MADLDFNFDVSFTQNADFAGSTSGLTRSKIQQESLTSFPIDMKNWRRHDAVWLFLPPYIASAGATTGNGITLGKSTLAQTITWTASDLAADRCHWIANGDFKVLGIVGRVEVAGTGGACTAVVKKAASATDIAAGTALHSGSFNLVGSVDTNQTLTISTTDADLQIPSGTVIGLDLTGTATSAVGSITIYLAPIANVAASDDLMLGGGTFGTGSMFVTAGNCKGLTTTRYARFDFMVPYHYESGTDIQLVFNAGMVTTVAGTSCTIDVQAFKKHTTTSPLTTLASADLISDSAQTMNNTAGTFSDIAFDFDPTTIIGGNIFDCRVAIAVVDGTANDVIPVINSTRIKADTRG